MLKYIYIIFILLNAEFGIGQNNGHTAINISNNMFIEFKVPVKTKRAFLKPRTTLMSKLNPATYLFGGLLFLYQNIVSEQIQAGCQYKISCSENMKSDIKIKGIVKGVLSGLNQLGNCSGSVLNDYPRYKIYKGEKINNEIE